MRVAYFASQANWNYFVTPFVFTRPDFRVDEIEPRHEDGQTWRSLRVTYPAAVIAHRRQRAKP